MATKDFERKLAAILIVGGTVPVIYNYYLRPSHPPVRTASVEKMMGVICYC